MFNKRFLIIPIFESEHWTLVIVCYPDAISNYIINEDSRNHKEKGVKNGLNNAEKKKTLIFYFDSLRGRNPRCLDIITQYLICEFATKNGNDKIKEQLENNKFYKEIVENSIEEYYPNVSCTIFIM